MCVAKCIYMTNLITLAELGRGLVRRAMRRAAKREQLRERRGKVAEEQGLVGGVLLNLEKK